MRWKSTRGNWMLYVPSNAPMYAALWLETNNTTYNLSLNSACRQYRSMSYLSSGGGVYYLAPVFFVWIYSVGTHCLLLNIDEKIFIYMLCASTRNTLSKLLPITTPPKFAVHKGAFHGYDAIGSSDSV